MNNNEMRESYLGVFHIPNVTLSQSQLDDILRLLDNLKKIPHQFFTSLDIVEKGSFLMRIKLKKNNKAKAMINFVIILQKKQAKEELEQDIVENGFVLSFYEYNFQSNTLGSFENKEEWYILKCDNFYYNLSDQFKETNKQQTVVGCLNCENQRPRFLEQQTINFCQICITRQFDFKNINEMKIQLENGILIITRLDQEKYLQQQGLQIQCRGYSKSSYLNSECNTNQQSKNSDNNDAYSGEQEYSQNDAYSGEQEYSQNDAS
ncbi:unnamed protein product (macronuclear) [Paramecium tetraurelia]|uniref:SHSP domain-containing protein n=1 Tax=Paramecium tetraurelia TaxID=5888 RepID=A0DKW1_PARTE|nr:uncharacterized protein GSPATT00017995001 [Paramecium tetraurelia]CAK83678.1 unnamed protein product [Paramecium tetraurelia]|eukprot:XP_001451075.1 hypothetical protein (macronuclear) [Paramecium tetraurelia strain d4-2]